MADPLTKADLEEALNQLERRLMIMIGGVFVIFAVVITVYLYL